MPEFETYVDVDVDEFEKLVASGNGLLLDVRTDAEYADAWSELGSLYIKNKEFE